MSHSETFERKALLENMELKCLSREPIYLDVEVKYDISITFAEDYEGDGNVINGINHFWAFESVDECIVHEVRLVKPRERQLDPTTADYDAVADTIDISDVLQREDFVAIADKLKRTARMAEYELEFQ